MPIKSKTKSSLGGPASPAQPNLNDVLLAVKSQKGLPTIHARDLYSSVRRVAFLLGDDPTRIPLDLPTISTQLASVNAMAMGVSAKTLSNLRSGFLTAVKVSGLKPVQRSARTPLSAAWASRRAKLSGKRALLGLARFARYASVNGIEPEEVNDATIQAFITAVRNGTLHRKPNDLHRKIALIWNEVAQQSGFELQTVEVPSFRHPPQRTDLSLLPDGFVRDMEDYLAWCAAVDPFATNTRPRALAARTIQLRRDQFHAAVTALVESGVSPTTITCLADLVSMENVRRILRRRHEMVDGRENVFNHDLARTLVQVAREWVKVDDVILAELKRLAGKVPTPMPGLTPKNKKALRQFDDPATLRRLRNFPHRLWAQVTRDPKPDARTLVRAQAALAVGIPLYMPIRLQNLASLEFDVHLFLAEAPGATSSLELSADEVKNRMPLAFDIPRPVAKMLIEYRNRIAPKIIGKRPDRLFVNVDGSPKTQWTVAWTIRTYLRRAGIMLSSHQFRHLAAMVMLDARPGDFENPRQLLGHKSLSTTIAAYAGIDTRRAARHHQRLVERALAHDMPDLDHRNFGVPSTRRR